MNKDVINPLTRQPLGKDAARVVLQAREARLGARKAARSGNPAKRAEAERALENIPQFIQQVYTRQASG